MLNANEMKKEADRTMSKHNIIAKEIKSKSANWTEPNASDADRNALQTRVMSERVSERNRKRQRRVYTTRKKCVHAQIGMSFVLAHSFTRRIYTVYLHKRNMNRSEETDEKEKNYSIV